MRKKTLIIFTIISFFIIGFIYFKYIFGWLEFRSNNFTPNEYKSSVIISKKQYTKDSLSLVSLINNRIKNHQHPYDNYIRENEDKWFINDSLTKVNIDSIFYSVDLNKIVFLVIVKNENKKLYANMTEKEAIELEKLGNLPYKGFHFDGKSFIGKRERNNSFSEISSFSRNTYTNSQNYRIISTDLKNECLNRRENKNNEKPVYNVDDKRFWNNEI